MNLTDKILVEGFAAILIALGMIAENQTRQMSAPWGAQWFDEAAGMFRNKAKEMEDADKKANLRKVATVMGGAISGGP